jgi:iron complex transport system substrate-binding protein
MTPNRHRPPFLLLLLAAAALFFPACERPASSDGGPAAIVLTDRLGRELRLAAPARRIVSLAPSGTETLFAIGAQDRLIARDARSLHPPEAAAIASIGEVYPRVNLEVVLGLEPDLVLAAGTTQAEDVRALAALGLKVYATSIASGLEDIYRDILGIGAVVGRDAEAARLVESLRRRAGAVAERCARAATRPRVLYEIDASDPGKPWTAGPESFIQQMLSIAGGESVGRAGGGKYFQMSLESLVLADPEIIVLGSSTYGSQKPEDVARRPGWGGLTAVRRGAVHPFDDDLISRPGPRVIDGLEALARLLHPELAP